MVKLFGDFPLLTNPHTHEIETLPQLEAQSNRCSLGFSKACQSMNSMIIAKNLLATDRKLYVLEDWKL